MVLSQDRRLIVFNIAWGKDLGEDFQHITTNISPDIKGATLDFFFTDEVASIVDPKRAETLWQADGTPSVR